MGMLPRGANAVRNMRTDKNIQHRQTKIEALCQKANVNQLTLNALLKEINQP